MGDLSDDMIVLMALNQDYATLINLIKTSNRFQQLIGHNEDFWRDKFIQDFGEYKYPVESWRKLYQDTGNLSLSSESIWGLNTECFNDIKAKYAIYEGRKIGVISGDQYQTIQLFQKERCIITHEMMDVKMISYGYTHNTELILTNDGRVYETHLSNGYTKKLLDIRGKFIDCGFVRSIIDMDVWTQSLGTNFI